MKTLKACDIGHGNFVGIVRASEWFGKDSKHIHSIYGGFFVVGSWMELKCGEDYKQEAKTTLAICYEKKTAEFVLVHEIGKRVKKHSRIVNVDTETEISEKPQ